jgi:hypothetical protein
MDRGLRDLGPQKSAHLLHGLRFPLRTTSLVMSEEMILSKIFLDSMCLNGPDRPA